MTLSLRHHLIGLASLVLCAVVTTSAALAGGSDPQVVLDEIYGQVAEMCGGDGQGAAYDLEAIAKTYFTPALAKTVSKAAETGDLDFDVLVDGQDCKVSDLQLAIVDGAANSATGRATFKNFDEPRTVDLKMVKSGSSWQVADIVYGHRAFSLKAAF